MEDPAIPCAFPNESLSSKNCGGSYEDDLNEGKKGAAPGAAGAAKKEKKKASGGGYTMEEVSRGHEP